MRRLLLVLAVFCSTIYGLPKNSPAVEIKPIVGGMSGWGSTTNYWDCCKPACGWPSYNYTNPVKSCSIDGINTVNSNTQSGCNQRTPNSAFACNDIHPWPVSDTIAFGFVAFSAGGSFESAKCCSCVKLEFQGGLKGKTMFAQVINTGQYGDHNHFDIAIPGGGVGDFNACDIQWNSPKDGWGDRYGGIHQRFECDSLLPAPLRQGCYFRYDWMRGVINPPVVFEEIQCPSELTQKTGCMRH